MYISSALDLSEFDERDMPALGLGLGSHDEVGRGAE